MSELEMKFHLRDHSWQFMVTAIVLFGLLAMAGCSSSDGDNYTPPTPTQEAQIVAARNKAVMDNPNIPPATKQWLMDNYGKTQGGGPPADVPVPKDQKDKKK